MHSVALLPSSHLPSSNFPLHNKLKNIQSTAHLGRSNLTEKNKRVVIFFFAQTRPVGVELLNSTRFFYKRKTQLRFFLWGQIIISRQFGG